MGHGAITGPVPDICTPRTLNPKRTWLNWNEMFVAAVRCVLYVLWLYTEPPASEPVGPRRRTIPTPGPGEAERERLGIGAPGLPGEAGGRAKDEAAAAAARAAEALRPPEASVAFSIQAWMWGDVRTGEEGRGEDDALSAIGTIGGHLNIFRS